MEPAAAASGQGAVPRVLLNLLWLAPEVVGGSEEATVALVRALAGQRPGSPGGVVLGLAARPAVIQAHPDLAELAEAHIVGLPGGRPGRIAAEHTWLALRSRRYDLVHHLGGTIPALRGAPAVLTVHDVQPLESSATHGAAKRAYLARAVPASVRAARTVLVPSEFVRSTVIERTGVDPSRVLAVPHALPAPGPATAPDELRHKYRIDGEVVLYPVVTYPHKNHGVLLEAFARLRRTRPEALLVLPGGVGSAEREVADSIRRLGVSDRVRRLGRIPAVDLAGLYGLARVVAFPSRYEGFGLGAAEALLRGVPVVAARAAALPEVVGDAGALVDPDDVEGWAAALAEVLGDDDRRATMAAAGPRHARRWDPAAIAGRTVGVYREALAADR